LVLGQLKPSIQEKHCSLQMVLQDCHSSLDEEVLVCHLWYLFNREQPQLRAYWVVCPTALQLVRKVQMIVVHCYTPGLRVVLLTRATPFHSLPFILYICLCRFKSLGSSWRRCACLSFQTSDSSSMTVSTSWSLSGCLTLDQFLDHFRFVPFLEQSDRIRHQWYLRVNFDP
jgi:hypothetical protein